MRRRHRQALRKAINRNHALGTERVRALDGKLFDGPAAEHGDAIAWLNVASFRRLIARRENIAEMPAAEKLYGFSAISAFGFVLS